MAHRKIHQYNELKKCGEDIVYFANTYYYVNSLEGNKIVELHPKQEAFLRASQEGGINALTSSRQLRKSTTLQILALWTLLFKQNQCIVLDADRTFGAKDLFDNIRKAHGKLPKWMRLEDCCWTNDAVSGQSKMFVCGGDDCYEGMRLSDITLFLFDEIAWATPTKQKHFKEIYPLLINNNTSICTASTPNKIGTFNDIMNSKHFNKFVWTWRDSPQAADETAIQIIKSVGLDVFLKEYMLVD